MRACVSIVSLVVVCFFILIACFLCLCVTVECAFACRVAGHASFLQQKVDITILWNIFWQRMSKNIKYFSWASCVLLWVVSFFCGFKFEVRCTRNQQNGTDNRARGQWSTSRWWSRQSSVMQPSWGGSQLISDLLQSKFCNALSRLVARQLTPAMLTPDLLQDNSCNAHSRLVARQCLPLHCFWFSQPSLSFVCCKAQPWQFLDIFTWSLKSQAWWYFSKNQGCQRGHCQSLEGVVYLKWCRRLWDVGYLKWCRRLKVVHGWHSSVGWLHICHQKMASWHVAWTHVGIYGNFHWIHRGMRARPEGHTRSYVVKVISIPCQRDCAPRPLSESYESMSV